MPGASAVHGNRAVRSNKVFADGKHERTGYDILTTRRNLAVAVVIYDLELSKKMWEAEFEAWDTTKRKVTAITGGETLLGQIVGEMAEEVLGTDDEPHPDPPSPEIALKKVHTKFAKELFD